MDYITFYNHNMTTVRRHQDSLPVREDVSSNEYPHDFVGPLKNHVDSGVPQILLHWVVFEVTVATVQLQCLIDHLQEE